MCSKVRKTHRTRKGPFEWEGGAISPHFMVLELEICIRTYVQKCGVSFGGRAMRAQFVANYTLIFHN